MQIRCRKTQRRPAIFLVWTAFLMIPLLAFVAFAIDLGLIMTARSHCQNAADAAAMAGARTLNGNPSESYNYSNVDPNAKSAAGANKVLSRPIDPGQLTLEIGRYAYNRNEKLFEAQYPGPSTEPWSLVKSTVDYAGEYRFAKVLGINTFNTSATATAVHRPRDVCVVVDFSGSMRFDTLLGLQPHTGGVGRHLGSNNPESVVPTFGHYSDTSAADLQQTDPVTEYSGSTFLWANWTTATDAGPAIINDLFPNFVPAPDSFATTPGGDVPLKHTRNRSAVYARTVARIVYSNNRNTVRHEDWETNGYDLYGGNFGGYTIGPGYWGKTFWIWPPDPRPEHDWRRKFFNLPGTNLPIDDNTRLYDSQGNFQAPGVLSYSINYDAILDWIKNTGPNPFPSELRVGGIVYYTEIPSSFSTINTALALPTMPNNPGSQRERNERFWKDYIDHVLGVLQGNNHPKLASGLPYSEVNHSTGYGEDFAWTNGGDPIRITGKPAPGRTYGTPPASMDYRDNPRRPKLRFWFGPTTMADFLGNYGADQYGRFWWPGTIHEAPMWQCKLGIQAALQDMKLNHPNDHVSLIFFSSPKNSANTSDTRRRFNRVRAPMGQEYDRMINALWFPLHYLDTGEEISPYDTDASKLIREVPIAAGGTSYPMGLMLAYNQFSSNAGLRTYNNMPGAPVGDAGGLGRQGASRLIIFESDGMVNSRASAGFSNSGRNESFYNVRAPNEFPSSGGGNVVNQTRDIVDHICALDTDAKPGYSTERKPVIIHCLAFGTLFDSNSTNPNKQDALDVLQYMQFMGGKAGGEQPTASTPLPDYKRIIGSADERVEKLKKAFITIMQDGVQISLIE